VSDGDPQHFVDIVCLSLGYHIEGPKDGVFTGALARVLGALGQRGVQVVASAGNDATTRPTYPAALTQATKLPPTPLVSVGSLNPNRTRSIYSNDATWVTDWEVGTGVVSTLPAFDGGKNPTVGIPRPGRATRESLDPDDFSGGVHRPGGFARWSGTSFAAAAFAARIAQAMLSTAAAGTLLAIDPTSAGQRAAAALKACRGLP
jgi:hypothetical protein